MGAVGECISGGTVHAEQRHNLPRLGACDVLHFVRVHAYQTRHLHLFAVGAVEDDVALRTGRVGRSRVFRTMLKRKDDNLR